jgi:hypothetical protein
MSLSSCEVLPAAEGTQTLQFTREIRESHPDAP